MALWPAPAKSSQLALRLLSAALLAPPVLAAVYFGAPYLQVLAVVIFGLAAWEWSGLCTGGQRGPAGWLAVAGVALAVAGFAVAPGPAAGLLVTAAVGVLALSLLKRGGHPLWLAAGVLYVGFAGLAVLAIRQRPDDGLALIFWLLALVWVTDSCAYFVGRSLGGPKLAPSISPKKTWSGFFGGLIGGALVGFLAALLRPDWDPGLMAAASAGLALLAQAGDLFESRLKRRFGVKDSSRLIPGHGGLLDRLDSILVVMLAVASAYWLGFI